MSLTSATVTFDIADQLGNDFDPRRTKVWLTTNVPGDTVIDKAANKIRLGSGNVTLNADGTGSIVVWVPGADANPASWQTTFHVDYPDRNAANRGRGVKSFGPFTITANADLADLVAEMPVRPEYAAEVFERLDALEAGGGVGDLPAKVSGYTDHGNVSGAVTFTGPNASHRFDATAPTTVTLSGYSEGDVATLICFSGADDVTVNNAGDVTLADGCAWSAELARGVWVSGGGGGEPAVPDTTPPSAITDLVVTPGDDGVTATASFTPATDADSTVKYRYRLYPTGTPAPAWPTSGAHYNLTGSPIALTGLTIGVDYVMELQAYSAGGSAVADSATFTTPTPAGWNVWDSIDFADQTAGTFTPPKDFTTDNARTLRATGPVDVIVGSGKIKTPEHVTDFDTLAFLTGVVPVAPMRITSDFEIIGTDSSYDPMVSAALSMTVGAVVVSAALNWQTGNTRRIRMGHNFGTGAVYTAGPGYTMSGGWVDGIATTGELQLVANVEEQTAELYLDGTLVIKGDFSANVYEGSPNYLIGAFVNAGFKNGGAFRNMTIEQYTA